MDKLKVYWFGYGGNSWLAEKLRYMIEDDLRMKLITIHEHPNADIPWSLDTVYQELSKADIIIVPANFKRQPCKSNNRLTQAMAFKKPVICDPLPAYLEIVENGVNAFITSEGNDLEWYSYLKTLRDDSDLRDLMGKAALKTARKYSIEAMTLKWLDMLSSFDSEVKENGIDVIIPTRDNPEMLEECLKSFENSTKSETIYIVDNSESDTVTKDVTRKLNVPIKIREC